MKPTQHEKIIKMCSDGAYHCQNEFRALYIFSPHKRRAEIQAKGRYHFIAKPCEHGVRGQPDYKMEPIAPVGYEIITDPETGKELARRSVYDAALS